MSNALRLRSADALAVVDKHLRITSWNTAAEGLTGIPAAAAVGNRCWRVLGGRTDDGTVVCHAGCVVALGALTDGDVKRRPLLIHTVAGRRRVLVTTITADVAGDVQLVHVLNPAPATTPAKEVDRLTRREREVLALLGDGLDARVIAERLGISVATVRTHIRHILTTLGVSSQLAAVSRAALGTRVWSYDLGDQS